MSQIKRKRVFSYHIFITRSSVQIIRLLSGSVRKLFFLPEFRTAHFNSLKFEMNDCCSWSLGQLQKNLQKKLMPSLACISSEVCFFTWQQFVLPSKLLYLVLKLLLILLWHKSNIKGFLSSVLSLQKWRFTNYRPISLSSTLSKVRELMVRETEVKFWIANNVGFSLAALGV